MTLATPKTETDVRSCLMHGDYHVWTTPCYTRAFNWAVDRVGLSPEKLEELWELAVEEKILLSTWRTQRR